MKKWTELVQFDPSPNDPFRANSTPIYQTATFAQEIDELNAYDYTRSGNPTRDVVQQQIAKLEKGQQGFVFNSGMAALTSLMGLLEQGDHVIASRDLYGGTHRLLSQRLPQRGITYTLVDTTDIAAVAAVFLPTTRLLLIETPSNPLQKISDIQKLGTLAHENKAYFAVDNTFLSPWLQKPLLLGADIVIHSATKHLGGHSDITAGVIVVKDPKIAEKIAFIQNAEGTALAPFECWLLLRGLKTLGLRIERQQQIATDIANYLKQHDFIKKVYYPGLIDHPHHDLHFYQARGAGTVISFETGSLELSKNIIRRVQLFTLSVSFGSLNSLINLPCAMSHASIPIELRELPADLIRLSIGIEDAEDLISDLGQALQFSAMNNVAIA